MSFKFNDASGLSQRTADSGGTFSNYWASNTEGSPIEADPLGSNVGLHTPYFEINPNPNEPDVAPPLTSMWNSFPGKVGQIEHAAIDGMQVPLWFGLAAEANGSAVQCPQNYCGARTATMPDGTRMVVSPFQAYADGTSGYGYWEWQVAGGDVVILNDDGTPASPEEQGKLGEPEGKWVYRVIPAKETSSWDPFRQTQYVPLPTEKEIETKLEERAGDPKSECAKAVENIINKLAENTGRKAKSTKLSKLLKRVKAKNIKLDPKLAPFNGRADFVPVLFGDSREIKIDPADADKAKDVTLAQNAYITSIIHELVHHAAKSGTYSDRELAEAANDLLIGSGEKPPDLPSDASDVEANGRYVQLNYFNKYCPSPGGSK